MAPPSTPAQSRFILPRKSQAQQAQKQTPSALQNGPFQFASTPRFNASAAPRQASHQPPPFSTPAPQSTKPRATPYEPLSDTIDTSPISPETTRHGNEDFGHNVLNESIEIDSPSASRSPFGQDGPPPKRRRVSISPEVDVASDRAVSFEPMDENEQVEISSTPMLDDRLRTQSPIESYEPMTASEPGSPQPPEGLALRQPTFRNAPRFKATEVASGAQQRPLPDAFSPQRRGAKYVPGGLAAEVRDWLVQVKGASEYDRPAGSDITRAVHQVESGSGTHIVSAQQLDGEDEDADMPARVILAGDGRTSGLGERSIVRKGGLVSMFQPMWDITLDDLGRFAVACDWEAST